MAKLFDSCRDRIERARMHREAAAEVWKRLEQKDFHTIGLYQYGDGRYGIWAKRKCAFPGEISMLLGEMLYQLRAALDGAAYTAVCADGNGEPQDDKARRQICFPVSEFPERFAKAVKRGSLGPGPLSAKPTAVIEAMQFYNRVPGDPRDPCRAIHILDKWSAIDRHRKLHVVGSQASLLECPIRIDGPTNIVDLDWVNGAVVTENETILATFRIDPLLIGAQMDAKPKIFLEIGIDEPPQPIDSRDMTSLRIGAIFEAVEGVVDRLEASFEQSGSPACC